MEGDIENKKIGFFERIKLAIFKLEDYGMFLGERLSVAVKYFFLLILLVSIVTSIATTYTCSKMIKKFEVYAQNELPDFTFENANLKFSQNVDAYDNEFEFSFIADTNQEISKEIINNYKNKIVKLGLILLSDKAIFVANNDYLEIEYTQLIKEIGDITITNKQDIINLLTPDTINYIIGNYFFVDVIGSYLYNIASVFLDVCVVAVFGWIASRFCGIYLKVIPVIQLSIYSLTLSLILSAIYSVTYVFTNFYIEYFDIIYLLIAYVYIIAAIFMVKYDLIKHNEEIEKLLQVEIQVKKEPEDNEENKEDKKEKQDDKQEDKNEIDEPAIENNREPDGSEI